MLLTEEVYDQPNEFKKFDHLLNIQTKDMTVALRLLLEKGQTFDIDIN